MSSEWTTTWPGQNSATASHISVFTVGVACMRLVITAGIACFEDGEWQSVRISHLAPMRFEGTGTSKLVAFITGSCSIKRDSYDVYYISRPAAAACQKDCCQQALEAIQLRVNKAIHDHSPSDPPAIAIRNRGGYLREESPMRWTRPS